ncbi:MAG: PAS domain S-box protein, partial [Spirochaetota bacterium]
MNDPNPSSGQELHRLLSLLSATMESTAEGILALDLEGRVALYNQNFARMWDIPEKVLKTRDNAKFLAWARGMTRHPDAFMLGVRELAEHPEREALHLIELADGRVFERSHRPRYEGQRLAGRVLSFRDVTGHARDERRLSEERTLLRTLIDDLPDHLYVKDQRGRFITCNMATARFMGAASPEELIGKTDFDFYPQVVARRFYRDEQRIIRTGTPLLGHEEERTDARGRTYWISTTKMPLVDSEGEVTGIVGIGHDVTVRKKTEQALRESEERYRRFSELTREGIALFEKDVPVDTNTAFRRIFGLGPDHPLDAGLLDTLVLPEYHEQVRQNHTRGHEEPYQVMARARDGRVFPLEIEGRNITLEGRSIRVINVRDITARKKAEEALAYERHLLASLMDSMPDNIFFKDRESRFIRINRAVAEKFGLSDPSEAVGRTDFDFFTEEHAGPAYRDEQEVLRTGRPIINKEEKETFPDGREYWITTTRMPLRDEKGRVIGTFGISRDITDRVKAEQRLLEREEQLRRAQKIEAVGRLAGGIAHDFNNILTAIIGYAEISLMRRDLPQGLEPQVRQIKNAAQRAAALTDQLLAFSRKQAREAVVLDLNRLITNLHPMLERLIGENITLALRLHREKALV